MTSHAVADRSERLPGLDGLKGIAIVLVVLIHAAPKEPAWYAEHFIGGFTRLAVPLFLVITGFLAGWKGHDRRRFRRQALAFLRLHVVYGLFYWGVVLLLLDTQAPLTLKSVVLRFGEGAWAGQYYLVVLVQTFFLAGVALPEHFWRNRAWLALSAGAALGGLGLVSAAPALAEAFALPRAAFRLIATGSGIWLWFFYFVLGATLGARERRGAPPPLGAGATALAAAAAVVLATSGLPAVPDWGDPELYPYARLSILTGTTLLALGVPRLARMSTAPWLRRLGVESFGIYVLNPALLILIMAPLGASAGILDSLLRSAVVLLMVLPLVSALRRFAPFALP